MLNGGFVIHQAIVRLIIIGIIRKPFAVLQKHSPRVLFLFKEMREWGNLQKQKLKNKNMKIYLDWSFSLQKNWKIESNSTVSFKKWNEIYFSILENNFEFMFVNWEKIKNNSYLSEILAFKLFVDCVFPKFEKIFSWEKNQFFTDNQTVFNLISKNNFPNKKYNFDFIEDLKVKLKNLNYEIFWINREKNFADLSFLWNSIYDTKIFNFKLKDLKNFSFEKYSDLKIEDVYFAYEKAKKNKGRDKEFLKFEKNLHQNLQKIFFDIKNLSYQPKKYIYFINKKERKVREIFMSEIEDLIIQHFILQKIQNRFEKTFFHDVWNHRLWKWTHWAISRLHDFLRSASWNWYFKKEVRFLKADIKWFFFSINKIILKEILYKKVKEEYLKKLLDFYLEIPPTDFFKTRWKFFLDENLKNSLFKKEKHIWIPIWNSLSQFLWNIFLHELDFYLKMKIWVKYYIRYADDFIILWKSKEDLFNLKLKIKKFIEENLDLKLWKTKTYIRESKTWIRFLWKKVYWKWKMRNLFYLFDSFEWKINVFFNFRFSLRSFFGMI